MKVDIKKVEKNAILPTLGSEKAAGADLYACLESDKISIPSHGTEKISTGIAVSIPDGYVGLVFARSGLATKKGLAPANKVGVIDSDYRGTVFVALHNHSDEERAVESGERIAQLVIVPYVTPEWNVVDELDDTERGEGGFGSSGSK